MKDASDNMHAYSEKNEEIKAEMQRIVEKAEAMAFDAKVENERDYDLYSVYVVYPGGNRRFFAEIEFDHWLYKWSDHNHSHA